MSNYYTYDSDELYHYGVLGMKWGRHKAKSAVKKYSKKIDRQIERNTSNSKVLKKYLKTGTDESGLKLDSTTRKAYQHEYETSIKAAKAWMSAKSDIMNMDVSKISKADVKKRYSDATKNAGVYYPF